MDENLSREIFTKLNDINLKDKTQQKMGLSYLSWAYAWGELKTQYPDAEMIVYNRKIHIKKTITTHDGDQSVTTEYEYDDEVPYFTDEMTTYVKVGVNIKGIEYVETYPIMSNKNQAIRLNLVTMTDVNRAIQRAFVKACGRHGLGLYIYAGEDLPESSKKVIDYETIATNCDRFATVILTKDGFESMRQTVINGIQDNNYPEDAAAAITAYAVKELNGKRVSQLSFDIDNDKIAIQRIANFIGEVKKALAAPDGR